MYQKQQKNGHEYKPKIRLSFLHGKAKEEISAVFLKNKQFGWSYNPTKTDLTTILRWLPEDAIIELGNKSTTIGSIREKLEGAKSNERFTITIRRCMRKVRRDAPPIVEAIINIVANGNGGFRLVSEYVASDATKPITMINAEAIVSTLLNDETHPLHQFIKTYSKDYPTTSAKVFKETLANWDKVF